MAVKTTHTLQVQFAGENGNDFNFNLDDYKQDLTDSEIQSGAEAMLASGAIASGGHAAVAALGAKKIDTTQTDVAFV